MRRIRFGLLLVCLVIFVCLCAGAEETWPPAGKTEGRPNNSHFSGSYYFNLNGPSAGGWVLGLYPQDSWDNNLFENPVAVRLTRLSGDEGVGDPFSVDQDGTDWDFNYEYKKVQGEGEATYRLEMESEHYWYAEEFTARFKDMSRMTIEPFSEIFSIVVGEPVETGWDCADKFFKLEPEEENTYVYFMTPEGEYTAQTDQYEMDGLAFKAKELGDYPMELVLWLGENFAEFRTPVTMHVISKEEAEASGEARPYAGRSKKERNRLMELLHGDPEAGDVLFEAEDAVYVYRLEGTSATIQKILPLKAELTVPATMDGHPVGSIGMDALYNRGENMMSLTLEYGIRTVQYGAFSGAENLVSLTLPETLAKVYDSAFGYCHALREITLPKSLTMGKIENLAFKGIGLEDLVLSDGTSLMAESLAGYRREGKYKIKMSAYADGFEYLIREDDGAIVLGCDYDMLYENGGVMNVPETLNGHPVREIGQEAFGTYSNGDGGPIREVILPEGLEIISAEAFENCKNLISVRIPSTVKEIGSMAFLGINMEAPPALPEGLEVLAAEWFASREKLDATGKWTYRLRADGTASICGYAYTAKLEFPAQVDGIPVTEVARNILFSGPEEERKKTKQVVLPKGIKRIGTSAFHHMMGLTTVYLPEGLEEIGPQAFDSCELKNIAFPSTLRIIGERAFDSNKLNSLKLPEGLEVIGKEAFAWCEVSNLQLPESLKVIGDEAFYTNKLSSLTIPAGVERIGNGVFHPNGNSTLKKVTIESMTTELGKGVFGHARELNDWDNPDKWIDDYAGEPEYEVPELTLTCYPGSTADQLYQYHVKKNYLKWGEEHIATTPADPVLQAGLYTPADQIFELIISEGVTEIPDSAFEGLSTLNKVKLPSTLKTIGERAFADCKALAEITLPKELEKIGKGCFSGCGQLKKINLPKGITEIPDEAFLNCSLMKQATVENAAIVRIGDQAFSGCKALAAFKMGKGLESIGAFAFRDTGLKNAQVPDTVTEIKEGAFAGSAITSLTLPKGMTEIPKQLCDTCTELKNVKIPVGVKAIGDNAFTYCRSLNGVNLPEGLESIGENAFMQNVGIVQNYYAMTRGKQKYTALSAMKFPASLKTIGKDAFVACDSLTKVSFAKGSQLTEIGEDAFAVCVHLKEITLPDSLETLEAGVFINCVELQKANLGGGLKKTGEKLFKYCEAMTALTAPDSLTEIGENLLEGHGEKLTVTCGEGSAMEAYLQTSYPDVKVAYPKKK